MHEDEEREGWLPLRVLTGGGVPRALEPLVSRDAVTRVLVGAAADLLLRRIDARQAHSIRFQVERVLLLFDAASSGAATAATLALELDALRGLVGESNGTRMKRTAHGVTEHR
jgi:hypothetical protein